MQAKVGPVLCSGPTNVAVDNFAERLDRLSKSVASRCNTYHRLVIRGYRLQDEFVAFRTLIEYPNRGEPKVPSSKWKLHLSLAYWLLVLLRSPARGLDPLPTNVSPQLLAIQQRLDKEECLRRLRDVATGRITYADFVSTTGPLSVPKSLILSIFESILDRADFFCTTPAMTANEQKFMTWKNAVARGVAVDEAACMHRADLYCVWGNTLMPLMMGGDPKQLAPTIMTGNEKDDEEYYYHVFVQDGKISALEYFQAMGMPVHRLNIQLRMANGMFDTVSRFVYPEVPIRYSSPYCDVSSPKFAAGRALEEFIQDRYPNQISPCPKDKLWPVFLHVPGQVETDNATGSKRAPGQVNAALRFIVEFTKKKNVDPKKLFILSPYKANISLIASVIKNTPEFSSLRVMEAAATVDSFQGQEGDIAVVVMGTSHPKPGPGFTGEARRLNVMLTRSRCGLVVVGHIDVGGPYEENGGLRESKGDKAFKNEKVETVDGEIAWVNIRTLQNIYGDFVQKKRVIRLAA